MVLTSDKERVKSLIQDTLSLLCRNGLNFNKQFCIEALVGVTIDEDDVFLVNIKETVKSDKAIEEERLAEEAARLAEEVRQRQEEDRANTSSPSQSVSSTSYSVKHAQRKRQRDSAANESDTVDSDMFDSYSEPSEKRSFMEAGNVKRERLEQEDEDELVFVKEEPREDNSFQDQYGGHPGPSWNNPLPPVSQYNTQSSSHDMLQHPPLPPGAAGDMQYPQTQANAFKMARWKPRPKRCWKPKSYTDEDMTAAIALVHEQNMPVMRAAKVMGIPRSTLQENVKKKKMMTETETSHNVNVPKPNIRSVAEFCADYEKALESDVPIADDRYTVLRKALNPEAPTLPEKYAANPIMEFDGKLTEPDETDSSTSAQLEQAKAGIGVLESVEEYRALVHGARNISSSENGDSDT